MEEKKINQNKKWKIIVGLGLLIIILALLIWAFSNKVPSQNKTRENIFSVTTTPTYRLGTTTNVRVPEAGEKVEDENLAVPKISTKAGPDTQAKLRVFDIKILNDQMVPSEISAYQNDTVHLNLISDDKEYKISVDFYNFSQTVKPGKKSILEFQALHVGEFSILCSSCGNKKIGTLIIVPRK